MIFYVACPDRTQNIARLKNLRLCAPSVKDSLSYVDIKFWREGKVESKDRARGKRGQRNYA